MHDVFVNEFEKHLAGNASPAFHAHLASCVECRQEAESIARVSDLFAELRPPSENVAEPSPFFYTRVVAGIGHESNTGWSLLSPGAAFFRRVAFASLLVLAGLGSFLVVREGNSSGADAAAIMAQHDVTTAHAESSDRDLMLVTLASYKD